MAVTAQSLLKLFNALGQSRNCLLLSGNQFKELLYQGDRGCRSPRVDLFDLFSCAWHVCHTRPIYINRAPVLWVR